MDGWTDGRFGYPHIRVSSYFPPMRRYAVFFIAFPLALLFVRLGFWQLDRLSQRRQLNAALLSNRDLPPVNLSEAPPERLPRFRRVSATGYFDFQREIVIDGRSYQGVPAVIVVTPLRLPAGKAVLVERGLVLSADARTVPLEKVGEPDSSAVAGVVMLEPGPRTLPAAQPGPWPRHVQWLNPELVAPVYPYEILPYVIRRTALPATAPPGIRPTPLPVLDNGPHLSYAIQWFSFAIIAVVGSVFLYRNGARRGAREAR